MTLTKELKRQGYDLIEGPIRNHKSLQLWLKKGLDHIGLYYNNIEDAFISSIILNEIESPALAVNSTLKNEFGFNIGITVLEELLKSIGMGQFEISANIKSGKSVSISYDNAYTKEVASGEIDSYFSTSDFVHPNPSLLFNANNENILVITGVLYAKNLLVEIETNFNLDAALVAKLNAIASGKLEFQMATNNKLKMRSDGNYIFPVAVKANRIHFQKSVFTKTNLVTDTRDFF